MKFRKKPIVIEAVQLTWANWNEICDFVPKPWFVRGVWLGEDGKPLPDGQTNLRGGDEAIGLLMNTLEGEEFLASGRDWIIKGVKGEFYPCKPDIFAATYEAVTTPRANFLACMSDQENRDTRDIVISVEAIVKDIHRDMTEPGGRVPRLEERVEKHDARINSWLGERRLIVWLTGLLVVLVAGLGAVVLAQALQHKP